MVIIIDGKAALLKRGTSFEFISENRFFTGADSYTMSMTFPLRGCAQNIAIFGHINRKDCDLDKLLLACEIHDRHFHKYGSVSVVGISEVEVKTQFLEGRSASNFHSSLDDIYINEIQMPELNVMAHWGSQYYLRSYTQQKADGEYLGYVVFPWVNNTSGNIQNPMAANERNYYFTDVDAQGDAYVRGFPFLLEVIRRVLDFVGYEYDLTAIEESQWANLVICQAFPLVWEMPYMQQVLPHWTVSEFLEQVELFLNGQFDLNGSRSKLTFSFNREVISVAQTVVVSKVVDTHSVEISQEEAKDDYIEQKNLAYADCSHQMWKFYSCDWARANMTVDRFHNVGQMKEALDQYLECQGPYTASIYKHMFYCEEEDSFFVLKCYRTQQVGSVIYHYMRYQPVNMFCPKVVSTSEEAETVELRIVPACIDHTDDTRGDMLFVECGTLGDDVEDAEDSDENQTQAVNVLSMGETEKKEEFFDKLYVGFWDGAWLKYHPLMPHPNVDLYEMLPDNTLMEHHESMRLSGSEIPETRQSVQRIDQSVKFTFSFLSDSIPDVRSIFLVHGKRYLAEKITATFSAESGMSQLLKMVCYRMED